MIPAKEAVKLFIKESQPSVFHAETGRFSDDDRETVHAYPLKGGGFGWVLRVGKMDWDDMDACIAGGGRSETFEAAAGEAVGVLIQRRVAKGKPGV